MRWYRINNSAGDIVPIDQLKNWEIMQLLIDPSFDEVDDPNYDDFEDADFIEQLKIEILIRSMEGRW